MLMRFTLLSIFFSLSLFASLIQAPLISADEDSATVKLEPISKGVSGFIVRKFSPEHSSIIANAVVKSYDKERKVATLSLSEYDGLRQNALPSGDWRPKKGDLAILGFGYSRALLIAPNKASYNYIAKAIGSVTWMHPDEFAALLSYRGHPTPLVEDFKDFCTLSSAGLLYIYSHQYLYTLDCQSFNLLQITPAPFSGEKEVKLPFFSRVNTIREAWWGEGSEPLESYNYYLKLIVEHNQGSKGLFENIMQIDNKEINQLIDRFKER